jgi:nucleoside-diphosphate-sugar epimerase
MNVEHHQPVNIGNPKEFTVAQLAELVIELTGSKSKLIYEPLPVDDPQRRLPDITKAKSLLGWEPRVQLKEGLLETIAWYKKQLALV